MDAIRPHRLPDYAPDEATVRGLAPSVHDLVAHHGIMNALANHSRGVDRADFNLLSAAYHAGATVDYGFFAGSAEKFCELLAHGQKTTRPTLHRTSNTAIKVAGTQAISESHVIAYAEDADVQRLMFGRYLDRHACRGGQWRLTHRTYVMDGNTNRPNTLQRTNPPVAHDHFVPQGGKSAADAGRAVLAFYESSFRDHQKAKAMSPDSSTLDAALSRLAIQDLVSAYCRGVDRADAALLAALFWEDANVVSGVINGPSAAFAEQVTAHCKANLDYCFHAVSNSWIDVKGDHAVGEHYVIANMTAGGSDVMTGGRYLDSYARRDGVWKIKSRVFVADWNSTHPTTLQKDGPYAALKNWGCFGKNDPVYGHWASL